MSNGPTPMTRNQRMAALQNELAIARTEIRNSHALIAILVARTNGLAVIAEHDLQNADALGQLSIVRAEQVPGCIIMVKKPAE